MKNLLAIFFLLCAIPALAQLPESPPEAILESAAEGADPEEVLQQLLYYRQHPLDINRASAEELCTPGLFNIIQATAILKHRELYGVFIATAELQAITEIPLEQLIRMRELLTCNSKVNARYWKPASVYNEGRHTILVRSRFTTKPDGTADRYKGNVLSQCFSWRFTSGTLLDLGFNADKDAGEAYGRKGQPWMDSWNYHLFARPGGKWQSVAIGDYQVNCGQGLVTWTGFAGSKGPDVVNVRKLGPVLKPYSAFGEYGLYRGAAISYGTDQVLFSAWYSKRWHDSDADGISFRSIRQDGYHRTDRELSSAANLRREIAGFHLRKRSKQFQQELTVQASRYSCIRVRGTEVYQLYEPQGKEFLNASWSYAWQVRNVSVVGEFASDQCGNPAFLNLMVLAADPKLSMVLLHRYLSPQYSSFSADPFRENSLPVNEQGLYAGANWQFHPKIRLSAFIDYFRFPWLRYQVDAPSEGCEWLLQATWIPARNSELYLRMKRQVKQQNSTGEPVATSRLEDAQHDNLRADARLKLSSGLFFQARAEWTTVKTGGERKDGWLLFEEIDLKPLGQPWSLTMRYSVYSTADYDTRIYAFAQELPGSFSLPAFYGSGTSVYLLFRYRLRKGLELWVRAETSKETVRFWSPGIQLRWIFGT